MAPVVCCRPFRGPNGARAPTNPSVSTRRLPPAEPPRTERERFRQLQSITTRIASVGSELTGQEHRELTEKLTAVLDFLQQGRSFVIVEQVHLRNDTGVPAGDGDRDAASAVPEANSESFDSPTQPADNAAASQDNVPVVGAAAKPLRNPEMPNFNLLSGWGDSLDSPPRPEQAPATPTPSRRTDQAHQPAVPSPLTRSQTPNFSGHMVRRYAEPSPLRPTTSRETPSTSVSVVSRRPVPRSPSNLTTSPVASARRNLWSPNVDDTPRSVHRSRSRSPLQADDTTDDTNQLAVVDIGSPYIGPSQVIGGRFPRTRSVAADAAVAGPSSRDPHRTWQDGRDMGLQRLSMPPRVAKNRGRPKGSKTTVVGSAKK